MGFQDSAKKVQAALKKVLAEMPGVQDRFAETGDPTELDAAEKTIDRLSNIAQKHASKLATKGEMASPQGVPPPPQDPEAPQPQEAPETPQIHRGALQRAFGGDTAPAPAFAGEGPGPSQAVRKAFQPTPQADLDDSKRMHLPEAIKRNREAMEDAIRNLQGRLGFHSDAGSALRHLDRANLKAFERSLNEMVPDTVQSPDAFTHGQREAHPALAEKNEVLRLVRNIIKDEAALGKLNPEPVDTEGENLANLERLGALSPSEMQRGKVGPAKPAIQGGGTPNPVIHDEAEPVSDIEAVAPKVAKDYYQNSSAMLGDIEDFAAANNASAYEREFLRRVNTELGARPKRFTIEKLLTALTVGASAVTSAWITHRYGGQAKLDLNQDQRDYDARRAQIGREVWTGIQANERQDRSLDASMDRSKLIADRADARQDRELSFKREKLKADDVVKQFNAKVRYLEMTNRAAARRLHAYGLGIKEQIDTEQGKLRNEAEMVKFDKSKIENYRAKEVEAAQRIAELTADLSSAIENFGGGDDPTVGR